LLQLIENRPESQLIVTKEKEIKISNEQKAISKLFNQHFIDVAKSLVCVHPFILFLLEYFMPYCGIWAGFVFQESQSKKLDPFTRITNGIIERFWLFRKNRFKTKVHPALYVSQTLAAAIGQAKTFVEKLKKIEVDLSNSESDDDVNDIYSHKDTWNRRAESKNVILLKRKKNEGFYQKNKVIVLSKNK